MPIEPGQQLLHYRLIEKIGKGGMGEVYLAHDTKLDRRVALKILPESVADVPDRRSRFEREAKAIAALNHPNSGAIRLVQARQSVRDRASAVRVSAASRDRAQRAEIGAGGSHGQKEKGANSRGLELTTAAG